MPMLLKMASLTYRTDITGLREYLKYWSGKVDDVKMAELATRLHIAVRCIDSLMT